MKPILIVSHIRCEQPGYLCDFLDKRGIRYEKIHVEQGERLPANIDAVSGLALLGAPISVNDPLPWIADEIALIRSACASNLPVLGICFGGQLIAKALGGQVCAAESMQIGWHPVMPTDAALAQFGELPDRFEAFEWHGDTFSLPEGARALFTGECIRNQGFIHGNCLALQFHPEITAAMIHEWLERYAHCLEAETGCIQSRGQVLAEMDGRLTRQRRVADKLFDWWLGKVRKHDEIRQKRITPYR